MPPGLPPTSAGQERHANKTHYEKSRSFTLQKPPKYVPYTFSLIAFLDVYYELGVPVLVRHCFVQVFPDTVVYLSKAGYYLYIFSLDAERQIHRRRCIHI